MTYLKFPHLKKNLFRFFFFVLGRSYDVRQYTRLFGMCRVPAMDRDILK